MAHPKPVKEAIAKADAEAAKKKLEEAGAKVETEVIRRPSQAGSHPFRVLQPFALQRPRRAPERAPAMVLPSVL